MLYSTSFPLLTLVFLRRKSEGGHQVTISAGLLLAPPRVLSLPQQVLSLSLCIAPCHAPSCGSYHCQFCRIIPHYGWVTWQLCPGQTVPQICLRKQEMLVLSCVLPNQLHSCTFFMSMIDTGDHGKNFLKYRGGFKLTNTEIAAPCSHGNSKLTVPRSVLSCPASSQGPGKEHPHWPPCWSKTIVSATEQRYKYRRRKLVFS